MKCNKKIKIALVIIFFFLFYLSFFSNTFLPYLNENRGIPITLMLLIISLYFVLYYKPEKTIESLTGEIQNISKKLNSFDYNEIQKNIDAIKNKLKEIDSLNNKLNEQSNLIEKLEKQQSSKIYIEIMEKLDNISKSIDNITVSNKSE